MNNEVLNAIKTRRSIRKYKPEQITDEQLDAILEAGTYAATGMGKQSPVIVVVQKPELIAKLSKMNAAMGSNSAPGTSRAMRYSKIRSCNASNTPASAFL